MFVREDDQPSSLVACEVRLGPLVQVLGVRVGEDVDVGSDDRAVAAGAVVGHGNLVAAGYAEAAVAVLGLGRNGACRDRALEHAAIRGGFGHGDELLVAACRCNGDLDGVDPSGIEPGVPQNEANERELTSTALKRQ